MPDSAVAVWLLGEAFLTVEAEECEARPANTGRTGCLNGVTQEVRHDVLIDLSGLFVDCGLRLFPPPLKSLDSRIFGALVVTEFAHAPSDEHSAALPYPRVFRIPRTHKVRKIHSDIRINLSGLFVDCGLRLFPVLAHIS